jgi:3',5'-cyclic AMP phosphodiesterase CpdA
MTSDPAGQAVRLAHFSDIHITAPTFRWQSGDYFTKRLPGWINYRWLGRRHRFRDADQVLRALVKDLHARTSDRVIFSGDATALGFEEELAEAAAILGSSPSLPGLAVPGNHDYYTPAVAQSGIFERYFGSWQKGIRLTDAVYPFAQRVGSVWLVAVNSATGNRWFWDASGGIDSQQLSRLAALLQSLEAGPRILVTHYPVCLADGRPERTNHGLRNLTDLVAVAEKGRICLWLHGHRHGFYCMPRPPAASFPIICAGSATQHGLWSYGEYTLAGRHFHGMRRNYSTTTGGFQNAEEFDLDLRF